METDRRHNQIVKSVDATPESATTESTPTPENILTNRVYLKYRDKGGRVEAWVDGSDRNQRTESIGMR